MHFNFLAILFLLSFDNSISRDEDESNRLRRRQSTKPSDSSAAEEEPTHRIYVKYGTGKRSKIQKKLQQRSNEIRMHYDFKDMRTFVLTVTEKEMKELKKDPNVEAMVDDPKRWPLYIPESAKRHHRKLQNEEMQEVPYGIDMVQSEQAWEYGATGQGVKVCVVDTGVYEHPDLTNVSGPNSPLAFDQDGVGHGTHCAGTIAADNNEFGVVGVAPDAEIISVKVFSDDGLYAYSSGILSAARKCADLGANIISMSLGGPLPNVLEIFGYQSLLNQGIITVAAAGNFGNRLWSYPASYPKVISVAAIDQNKMKASFSQSNLQVDISAPGVDVLSTLPGKGKCDICESIGRYEYGTLSGTSMACPHVAGVLALLMSKFDATSQEYIDAIEQSAEDLGEDGKDREYGYGLVQAYQALEYLDEASSRSNTISIKSNPTSAPTNAPTNAPTRVLTDAPVDAAIEEPIHLNSISKDQTISKDKAISCDDDEMLFDFKLAIDKDASEISWNLKGQSDHGMSLTGSLSKSNEDVHMRTCIPNSCYIFTIIDSSGDGIKAIYEVLVDGNILKDNIGRFLSEDILSFGCGEYTLPVEFNEN